MKRNRENRGKEIKSTKRMHTLIFLFNKLEPIMSYALFQTQRGKNQRKISAYKLFMEFMFYLKRPILNMINK